VKKAQGHESKRERAREKEDRGEDKSDRRGEYGQDAIHVCIAMS
jgi:hypothetical protein